MMIKRFGFMYKIPNGGSDGATIYYEQGRVTTAILRSLIITNAEEYSYDQTTR